MRLSLAAVVALAALAAAPSPAIAQNASDEDFAPTRVRFGLLFGSAQSKFSDTEISEFLFTEATVTAKRRSGIQLGAYYMFPLGRGLILQPELHYIQKGAVYEYNGNLSFEGDPEPINGRGELQMRLAYLEMPVLARVEFRRADRNWTPFLVAGPTFALRGQCQFAAKYATIDFQVDCDNPDAFANETTEDPIKKFDYGVTVGGGLAWRFFGMPATLQLRYGQGLAQLGKENQPGTDARNNTISFLFGFGN